jgi:hypothetical protein
MVCQRCVGEFLEFPVCGVWFNLKDLPFFPTYFVAFLANVTFATITWDCVLGISDQSSFHQCPMERVWLILKMVLRLEQFPMRLNFSEIPLTYGIMTVPWYIVSEKWLLLSGYIMESKNSVDIS